MIFNWYRIFNKLEFDMLNLVSKTYRVVLQDIGQRDIFVTKGQLYSILYEGVFLTAELNGRNPYIKDGYAIYVNSEGWVYLGIRAVVENES